jgi:hypothetical protein
MKMLPTLALVSIALASFSRVRNVHAHRTGARPSAKPVEVERWEGEGGGLPTGGPGPGVRVEPTPQVDPDLVHPGVGLAG